MDSSDKNKSEQTQQTQSQVEVEAQRGKYTQTVKGEHKQCVITRRQNMEKHAN